MRKVRELHLPIRAPCLRRGDVLFWNAWTIHGSLDSQDPRHSRASVTCHAIADSHRFLSLQTRIVRMKLTRINGVNVFCPKDLALPRNRAILHIESHYPRAFYWSKRTAIRWMMRLKRNTAAPEGALLTSTAGRAR